MAQANDIKAFSTVESYIIELYATHRLTPGDCIYETTIAEKLGLSRTPVRDALGRLAANGFLEQTQGRRGYRIPVLSFEDLKDAFSARECLEEKIGSLAAQKACSADVEILRAINNKESSLFSAAGIQLEYMKANDVFHLYLAHITGNKYLKGMYEPVYWRCQLYVYYLGPFMEEEKALFSHDSYRSDTPHEHAEIIEAVAKRDSTAAGQLALEHVRATFAHRLANQFSCPPEILKALLKITEKRGQQDVYSDKEC